MLLLNALCLCSFAGTRRALVIGIGEYEDPAWGQIHGDRDAWAVAGMLRESGFRDLSVLVGRGPRLRLSRSLNFLPDAVKLGTRSMCTFPDTGS